MVKRIEIPLPEVEYMPPCPFCGCERLTTNSWYMDCGEVPALECADCYAGGPVESWLKLAERQRYNKPFPPPKEKE
jgi:hypothetical protein